MSVSELANILGTSLPTIRHDLDELAEKGIVVRSWGKAMLADTKPIEKISNRVNSHLYEKQLIARCAVQLIEEGDTIILDSGTTTMALAEELVKFKNLTVITNSLSIAMILSNSNVSLQMCGGFFHQRDMCLLGNTAEDYFNSVHFSKAFIGTTGLRIPLGFVTRSPFQTSVKRSMMKAADKVYYLMDSSKIDAYGVAKVAGLNEIDGLVTDRPLPKDLEKYFLQEHVNLYYAQKE